MVANRIKRQLTSNRVTEVLPQHFDMEVIVKRSQLLKNLNPRH